MTTSQMSTATLTTQVVLSKDGAKISYLTMGSGPAVLVIPGALSMAADYATFGSVLAEHFAQPEQCLPQIQPGLGVEMRAP